MADAPYIYLGTASQFPTVITSLGRRNIVAGIDNIKQALTELLTTPIGSVFFNRAWGSRLYLLLFEPNDTILESLAISFVKEAIDAFEPRVLFYGDITFVHDYDNKICYATISFDITATRKEGSVTLTINRTPNENN